DAASYITERYGFPCSRQWLAKLAVIGGGPMFRKAGRYPIYEPTELDRWAEARIGPQQRSTSEVDPARADGLAISQSVARQASPELFGGGHFASIWPSQKHGPQLAQTGTDHHR